MPFHPDRKRGEFPEIRLAATKAGKATWFSAHSPFVLMKGSLRGDRPDSLEQHDREYRRWCLHEALSWAAIGLAATGLFLSARCRTTPEDHDGFHYST